jgi:hypothetical protein
MGSDQLHAREARPISPDVWVRGHILDFISFSPIGLTHHPVVRPPGATLPSTTWRQEGHHLVKRVRSVHMAPGPPVVPAELSLAHFVMMPLPRRAVLLMKGVYPACQALCASQWVAFSPRVTKRASDSVKHQDAQCGRPLAARLMHLDYLALRAFFRRGSLFVYSPLLLGTSYNSLAS